ncbi:hypothetical protein [Acidovorax lacteus]|uniref:Uncharacterized protein n=1 Tax=Acidovorax lacteus TaxID=1924988 RepID=A0ABP8L0S0_9BURK
MTLKKAQDRRSGQDRRQAELGPPGSNERRTTIEPRQPEMVEIEVTEEELRALGFEPSAPSQPTQPPISPKIGTQTP